ncbi:hypothetical protein SAMD00019534_120970, partial [Acytostelium subglobosum LB1]|uniref:hypothetical protein n=1 Tax=Acytostelium subglobosum LB1 TaxID=1410327 RepID=UPI000644E171
IKIVLSPYRLNLRNPFGTAHSLTTVRNNALITITVNGVFGYGECGVPPKKPLCYFADYNDIVDYCQTYFEELKLFGNVTTNIPDIASTTTTTLYDPFSKLPSHYFQSVRSETTTTTINQSPFIYLLERLDKCSKNTKDYSFAARSCIETAILDCWSKHLKMPLYKLVSSSVECKELPFYYTVSLCPTMEQIIDCLEFGLKYTRYIKIKLDSDFDRGVLIVKTILELCQSINKPITKISIDANSSWTPEIALKYLPYLSTLTNIISMIEQPFPVETTKGNQSIKDDPVIQQWVHIKEEYHRHGLVIFADESVCNADDIDNLIDIAHGVNIKLEKTGGVREALIAITKARDLGMKVWIGSMVGSSLNSNAAAHLLAILSDYGGDLDGGLLVDDQSQLFTGGFSIVEDGLVQMSNTHYGVGVVVK